MSEKKVPALRFKGFSGNWERRILGEVATFSKGQGYSKSDLKNDGIPIILYGRMYTDYKTSINEIDTYTDEKPNSIYSRGTEVIVPASGESAEDIARASVVEQKGVLLGGDLNIIIPNSELNSIFLALSISNGNQREELSRRAQGKSVVHLRNPDLKEVNLHYPSQKEQTRIGDFFRSLDALISLRQQKLDKLVTVKKAMLSKMFPKDGETVPELRFAGFSGDWERKRFSDTLVELQVKKFQINSSEYLEFGSIPVVDQGQKRIIAFSNRIDRKITCPKNGVIIFGDHTRIIKFIDFDFVAGADGTQILMTHENYNTQFILFYLLNNPIPNTGYNRHFKFLKEIEFKIPTLPEQARIGDFFQNLDQLITLQGKELEKLNTIKKSLLDKMFV